MDLSVRFCKDINHLRVELRAQLSGFLVVVELSL